MNQLKHSISDKYSLCFSSVGHFNRQQRSSWGISPRFCCNARCEALRLTFSNATMSLARYRLQTGATYSVIGLTRVLYKVENTY